MNDVTIYACVWPRADGLLCANLFSSAGQVGGSLLFRTRDEALSRLTATKRDPVVDESLALLAPLGVRNVIVIERPAKDTFDNLISQILPSMASEARHSLLGQLVETSMNWNALAGLDVADAPTFGGDPTLPSPTPTLRRNQPAAEGMLVDVVMSRDEYEVLRKQAEDADLGDRFEELPEDDNYAVVAMHIGMPLEAQIDLLTRMPKVIETWEDMQTWGIRLGIELPVEILRGMGEQQFRVLSPVVWYGWWLRAEYRARRSALAVMLKESGDNRIVCAAHSNFNTGVDDGDAPDASLTDEDGEDES